MRKKTAKKFFTLALAKDIAAAAAKIKAVNLKILNLQKITSFTDYFVIASGMSDRQVEAIADNIVKELKEKGRQPLSIEGMGHAQWVVVDYGDVVVHIFYHTMREIYAIEKIWADAPVVRIGTRAKKK